MFSIKTLRHTYRTWTFLLYEDRHTVTPFHLDPGSSWSLTAVSTSGALSPLCSTSPLVEGLMFSNILYLRFTICTNGHGSHSSKETFSHPRASLFKQF